MPEPKSCTKCQCLEKDSKGEFVKTYDGGVELYHCKRSGEEKYIEINLASSQAICLENTPGIPIPEGDF